MRSIFLMTLIAGLLLSCTSTWSYAAPPDESKQEKNLRTLVNLLDYIGKDYSNAVKNGTIVNENEYNEMSEFSRQAVNVFGQLKKDIEKPGFGELEPKINRLFDSVRDKASAEIISGITGNIRQRILAMDLFTVIPPRWPDLHHGATIFETFCQSCHGENGFGDGALAEQLNPTPSNFHDSTLASQLSPLQAYNTLRLGIEGTGMKAFTKLSDQEAWDVAFYINSLRYNNPVPDKKRHRILGTLEDTLSLKTLATFPNRQWFDLEEQRELDVQESMSVLRNIGPEGPGGTAKYLDHAIALLYRAHDAYKNGDVDKANTLALNAYLNGVEPMETQIRANRPGLVSRIENQMIEVRSEIYSDASLSDLQLQINTTIQSIREAQNVVNQIHNSFWFSYLMSASILLREGMEAFLIILVILGVLKSMGADSSVKFVHGGWMAALLIGIISWFFTESLLSMSPLQRELMEGIGSFIAVLLLLYIGFWLHDKTHISKWKSFVEGKIQGLLDQNNRWGLAILAFIVVFREAFESVIFLSSISIETGPGNSGILLGTVSAIIAVILIGFVLIKFSTRLPIRSLFEYSSLAMAILAFILAGKAMHEFQEAGYLDISSIPFHVNAPLLGLYPTMQTLLSQFMIVGIILGLWMYSNRRAALQEVKNQ